MMVSVQGMSGDIGDDTAGGQTTFSIQAKGDLLKYSSDEGKLAYKLDFSVNNEGTMIFEIKYNVS
jgi:hypothetical protein